MSDNVSTAHGPRDLRLPVQERSAVRIAKVLEAAERMLEEVGPEKTSIPALADSAGVPRAAIYPFFSDKYALFSHLARIHMGRLREALSISKAEQATSWQNWVEVVVKATANYYNANPVASILLLRGSFTDDDHDAHATKNETIGALLRAKAVSLAQLPKLPSRPDTAAIAVELAFACMKYGYLQECKVSPAICREATHAVVAYLQQWDTAARP
jgi:AcrR family transcriptional regulator